MESFTLNRVVYGWVKRHHELALIATIVLSTCLIQYVVPHKLVAMNFLFLPTVAAAYMCGMRYGGVTALFSFLIISIYAIVSPESFVLQGTPLLLGFDLIVWGAFLGLTALAVGSLCEHSQRQVQELKKAYIGVLEILAKFLESADQYTQSHSVRVARLSTAIASEIGLSEGEIEDIRAGALLHDIGKTESMDLVKRSSGLSESELAQVATHTISGAELVRSVGSILRGAVPIILYHHHHFGGRPGQEGPFGKDIPLGARIVAAVDAYDAIVTDRPYRKGRAPWLAMDELERCAGTQFDPDVVAAFRRVMPRETVESGRDLDEQAKTDSVAAPPEREARERVAEPTELIKQSD